MSTQLLIGESDGVSEATSDLAATTVLPGASVGTSVVGGALAVATDLAGASHGASVAGGALEGEAALTGASHGVSTAGLHVHDRTAIVGASHGVSAVGAAVLRATNPVTVTVVDLTVSGENMVSAFGVWVTVASSSYPVTMAVQFHREVQSFTIPDGNPIVFGVHPAAGVWPDGDWPTGPNQNGTLTFKNPEGAMVARGFSTAIYAGPDFRFIESSPLVAGFARTGGALPPAGTFLWDFGNGDTDTVENPASLHTYASAAEYTVVFTITMNTYDPTDMGAGVTARSYVRTRTIHITGLDYSYQPKILASGYDDNDTPVSIDWKLGLPEDVKLRGVTPLPGDRLLATTESGAFLYNSRTKALLGQIRITNRVSQTTPFSEKSTTWPSEICSVPIWHCNVNLMDDGRQSPFGWLVVRRTANVILTDEDRGDQGLMTRAYAHWNIHFDPEDFSAPGPVVGEFHFLKDPTNTLAPDEFALQEITWLDGCSTSAYVADHQNGYSPDFYTGDVHQVAKQPIDPLKGAGYPTDIRPNRFYDSYVVFTVLIEVANQFPNPQTGLGWQTEDRIPRMPVIPGTTTAHLIFINGGCRDATKDPPLKFHRIHYIGFYDLANKSVEPLNLTFEGFPGSAIPEMIQWHRLPMGLPYLPNRYYDVRVSPSGPLIHTNLWKGNFLYSNLWPERYGGASFGDQNPVSQVGRWAIQWEANREVLPLPGYWPEQIWVTFDGPRFRTDPVLNPWATLIYPDTWGWQTLDDIEDWGCQPSVPYSQRRRDALGGAQAIRFLELVPSHGPMWVPGPFVTLQSDWAPWAAGDRIYPVHWDWDGPTRGTGQGLNPVYRRFQCALRAFVALEQGTDNARANYKPEVQSFFGMGYETWLSPLRWPWLFQNSLRSWETSELLYSMSHGLGNYRRIMAFKSPVNSPGPVIFNSLGNLVENFTVTVAGNGVG